jgi:hypothetical protein
VRQAHFFGELACWGPFWAELTVRAVEIEPMLTPRTKIVSLALGGKSMSQICQMMHHSRQAGFRILRSNFIP